MGRSKRSARTRRRNKRKKEQRINERKQQDMDSKESCPPHANYEAKYSESSMPSARTETKEDIQFIREQIDRLKNQIHEDSKVEHKARKHSSASMQSMNTISDDEADEQSGDDVTKLETAYHELERADEDSPTREKLDPKKQVEEPETDKLELGQIKVMCLVDRKERSQTVGSEICESGDDDSDLKDQEAKPTQQTSVPTNLHDEISELRATFQKQKEELNHLRRICRQQVHALEEVKSICAKMIGT